LETSDLFGDFLGEEAAKLKPKTKQPNENSVQQTGRPNNMDFPGKHIGQRSNAMNLM
jgi:hypothetical protein